MNEKEKKLAANIEGSRPSHKLVAGLLWQLGYAVTIQPTNHVSLEGPEKYTRVDPGDISIPGRIEVRHLSAKFTCAADWPFKDFIVGGKNSYDKAMPQPLLYIVLNAPMTHAGLLLVPESRHRWWTDVTNESIGGQKVYYYAPTELVHWLNIEEIRSWIARP